LKFSKRGFVIGLVIGAIQVFVIRFLFPLILSLNPISVLLDIGNVIFFLSGFPQLLKAIRNRNNLKGISPWAFIGYSTGCVFFFFVGILLNSWLTVVFNIVNCGYFGLVAYWAWRNPK